MIAHGLPRDQVDVIKRELTLWYLPNFVAYPVSVLFALFSANEVPEPAGDDVLGGFKYLGILLVRVSVWMAIAAWFVHIVHMWRNPVTRRFLRDLVYCVEQLVLASRRDVRLEHVEEWHQSAGRHTDPRTELRELAWKISGRIAVAYGFRRRERNADPINSFGRWIFWAADSLDDRRRVEGGMCACVDMIRHFLGPKSGTFPRLQKPSSDARIVKPKRSAIWLERATRMQPVLVALLALATALVTFIAKLW